MEVRVGSSPDSWGVIFPSDPKQTPWQRFLDEVAQAEYDWIELGPYGYLPTDLTTLQPELERRNLQVVGAEVMHPLEDPSAWPALEAETRKVAETMVALGADYVMLIDDVYRDLFTGDPTAPTRLDDGAWKRLIDTTNKMAEIVRDEFGLALVFHPHADSHVEHEDQIEKFLEETDPDLISLCFDTGHHAYVVGDPVEFVRKHHRRISCLHFKNVDENVRNKVLAENIPFGKAIKAGVFCELFEGVVDFVALCEVLNDIDYNGFAIVEQDMYPVPFDVQLPIAKRARAYLREIGMG